MARQQWILSLLTMLGLTIGWASTAPAELIATTDGNGGDASVSEEAPDRIDTDTDDTRLFIRRRSDSSQRHQVTYLRFDLSTINTDIAAATLQLYQTAGNSIIAELYGLNDSADEISSPWDQYTITYNTAPGMNAPDGNTLTVDLDMTAVTSLGTYSISTTDNEIKYLSSEEIVSFLNADTNGVVTFIMESQDVGATNFRSSRGTLDEGQIVPTLDLTLDIPSFHPGDANGDGMVNLADLQILGDNWQSTTASWSQADFTGDNTVNLADLQIIGDNWGYGVTPDVSFDEALAGVVIPEPANVVLLVSAGTLVLMRRGVN